MPIKDFKCEQCDFVKERLCKYDTPQLPCPECGGVSLPQLSAPKGIQFKGTGFYETDYKGKS